MKTTSLLGLLIAALLAFSVPTASAKGKKKNNGPAPQAEPQPPAKPDYSQPAEVLAPYITRLDQLLALNRTVPKPVMPFMEQAQGQIVVTRLEFATLRKTAAEADHAKFDAAIATCDALTRALDERQTVLGNIQASSSVKGSGRLDKGPRKDTLSQGVHGGGLGGGLAKAVGAIEENKRERAETAAAKKSAAQTDNSLTAMSINRWNKRAIEWRTFITDAYSKTK